MFPSMQRSAANQIFFRPSPLMRNLTSMPIRGYLNDTRLGSNSNNFLVLEDSEGTRSPNLKFTSHGPSIDLHSSLTLQ